MNRLFGTGKKKAPPPNLTDAIANVRDFVLYRSLRTYIMYKCTTVMNLSVFNTMLFGGHYLELCVYRLIAGGSR